MSASIKGTKSIFLRENVMHLHVQELSSMGFASIYSVIEAPRLTEWHHVTKNEKGFHASGQIKQAVAIQIVSILREFRSQIALGTMVMNPKATEHVSFQLLHVLWVFRLRIFDLLRWKLFVHLRWQMQEHLSLKYWTFHFLWRPLVPKVWDALWEIHKFSHFLHPLLFGWPWSKYSHFYLTRMLWLMSS